MGRDQAVHVVEGLPAVVVDEAAGGIARRPVACRLRARWGAELRAEGTGDT